MTQTNPAGQENEETEWLTPLGYVNAVERARKRARAAETKLMERVPESDRQRAKEMLRANDGR